MNKSLAVNPEKNYSPISWTIQKPGHLEVTMMHYCAPETASQALAKIPIRKGTLTLATLWLILGG